MDAPPVTIEAVEVGPLFRGAAPAVLGMDGAFSCSLGGGRSRWVFGDTLLGNWAAGGVRRLLDMPSCTSAEVDDADWVQGFAHARIRATQVLDDAGLPKDHRRWPLDVLPGWLFYVEIAVKGTGMFDFDVVGSGVAAERQGRYVPQGILWGQGQPAYGGSVLAEGGYTYVFAPGPRSYLARTQGKPTDLKAYRYWDGKGWVADAKAAAALPDAGPEASVRWNAYLHRFVLVDVPSLSHELRIRFATRPEGPWSAGRKLLDCLPADARVYGGKQHVELDQDGGRRIVVTYNTNLPDPPLSDCPDIYWPRAVRVTFTR